MITKMTIIIEIIIIIIISWQSHYRPEEALRYPAG
jgi:hypothetical protein